MFSHRHSPIAAFLLICVVSHYAGAQPIPNRSPAATVGVPNMACHGRQSAWNNCVGAVRYPNGNIYQGEFHHGLRDGFGFIVINAQGVSNRNSILSNEQSIYAGQFREDRLNGRGVWFTRSGAAYLGTYKDNIPQPDVSRRNCSGDPRGWSNCVATVRYGNGNVYRGEFVDGRREGIGMIEIRATGAPDGTNIRTPVPGVYVGEFKDDRLNGRGMIWMPGGGFYGTFVNNVLAPTI
jgi:hypothetical protein